MNATWMASTAFLMAACAPVAGSSPPTDVQAPEDFPEAYYQRARDRGEPVFRVRTASSEATVHVLRAGSGPLAFDHAIASRDVHGYILLRYMPVEARADLFVPCRSLTADAPAARAQAELEPLPAGADVAGTRRNMLEKVLEADRYPYVIIHIDALERESEGLVLSAQLTLHGVTRSLRIPVDIGFNERSLEVSGRFSLRQTDFGIVPFSAPGGAPQVQDQVELQFRIRADRLH